MPRIIRFHETGGPEVLKLEEVATQLPGPGEVRMRVQAVGLNRAEALFVRGHYLEQPKLPSRIGYEAAGVVEAVGTGVDTKWIGKKVATIPGFSMSENGVLGDECVGTRRSTRRISGQAVGGRSSSDLDAIPHGVGRARPLWPSEPG